MNYVFALLFLAALANAQNAPDVQVKNLRLFYGQAEYFIKGITYSPSPLAKQIENQQDGTGYCTPHVFIQPGTFTTQTISPCYYDDYMDATSYKGYAPNGMTALWQRDFPLIKAMGVNTIRTYHAHPVTQATINSDSRYTDKTVQGSNHVPFLDMAQQYGFKVVFPLFADQSYLTSLSSDLIQYYIRTMIDEVGNHPALLMFAFGNELQFFNEPQSFLDMVNSYIDYARAYQSQKWGRLVPFTCALIDYPPYYNQMAATLRVDVMTSNAGYRGFDFSDLWSGSSQQSGWKILSCQSGKPMLIGEFGVHSNTPVFDVPSWFGRMYGDILAHKNQGAIGGFLFSYSEEHWKGVAYYGEDWTTQPDVYMGPYKMTPGSGQFPVDVMVSKTGGAYDINSITSGFTNQNVWAQDGPNTLSTVPNNFCSGTSTVVASQQPAQSSGGNANCPSTLSACGSACYNPSQYCCDNGSLKQVGQCSTSQNSASTTTQSPAANPSTTTQSPAANPSTTTKAATANPSTTTQSGSSTGDICQSASYCGAGTCACGSACYSQSQYCCSNGNLKQAGQCSTQNAATSNSGNPSTTTQSPVANPSTTTQSPAANPSTTTNSGTPTTASSSSNTCQMASYCGAGAPCGCNGACYSPTQYCCPNNQLTQLAFCSNSNTPSTQNSASTTTQSPAANPSTTTKAATANPSTTTQSGSSTGDICQSASYCGAGTCACGRACYSQSQYCCKSGQLTQSKYC